MKYLFAIYIVLFSNTLLADEHDYQFMEVGGNNIAYLCKGAGDTTVLLMAGMGLDAHASFKNTFHNIEAKGFQLCFYERAGTGKSVVENPKVRVISELADELTLLTQKLDWKKLVLVPHSFGGLVAKAFTHKNPDVVKGIVFVDSVHESWYQDMKSSMSESGWNTMEVIFQWERNKHSYEDFVEASSQSDIYAISSTLPVIVMSRGIPHVTLRKTKMSYSDIDAYTDSWNRSQERLLGISKNSEKVTMQYASHLFDDTDPWIVIEYIEKMVSIVNNEKLTTK